MGDQGSSGRKEIYTYEAPWQIYAMGWCQRSDPGDRYRLAVGSFTEEYNNKVQVSRSDTTQACSRLWLELLLLLLRVVMLVTYMKDLHRKSWKFAATELGKLM